jgi:hypothetical protein
MSRARLPRSWLDVVAALGLAAGVIAAGLRKLGDFDLPWHLAAGRAIWRARSVFLVDDFSYTHAGLPDRYEPIADLALYAAERLGGAAGVEALGVIIVGLMAWALVARVPPGSRRLGLALAAWALMAATPWLIMRPAIFSFALLAGLMYVIDRHRRSRTPRSLLWAVPVQWVWANCHGFAPLGLGVLGLFAGHALVCRWARGRLGAAFPADEGVSAGPAALVFVAAVAVTCLSPFGVRIFTLAWQVRDLQGLIMEWSATTATLAFRDDLAFVILAAMALLAVAAGREPEGGRAPRAFDLALVVGLLVLAIMRARLIPVFAVVGAPFVAARLAPRIPPDRRGIAIFAAVSAVGCAPVVIDRGGDTPGIGFNTGLLPAQAVEFVRQHHLRGNVWNFLPFGGYLAWQLHPEARVFIDGRTVRLYSVPFLRDYVRAEDDPAAFAALDRRYHFEWALVWASPMAPFSRPLAENPRDWVMVYLDDVAAVYVRRDGVNRALADGGYRVLHHHTPGGVPLLQPPAADAIQHDGALAVAQAPGSARAHLFAAAACLARDDRACAIHERERIAQLDPTHPSLKILDGRLAGWRR